MSDCGELEKCCTDVSCEQACLGQAPLDSQRYCSRVCKVQKTRCECENGGKSSSANMKIYYNNFVMLQITNASFFNEFV